MRPRPHLLCAQVLDTLRESGLTFNLSETPYSAYITIRKKFIKEYSPSPQPLTSSVSSHQADTHQLLQENSRLKEMLELEKTQHNHTKLQLSLREGELIQAIHGNDQNIEESRKQLKALQNSVANLSGDLAQEIDDHAKSEDAVRSLENRIEKLHSELEKEIKKNETSLEENESLREKLSDAEEAAINSQNLFRDLNAKLLKYELRNAELSNTDTGAMDSEIKALKGQIEGKDRIIALMKNQVELSLTEINHLRQFQTSSTLTQNIDKFDQPHVTDTASASTPSSFSDLKSGTSQLDTNLSGTYGYTGHTGNDTMEQITAVDKNDNLPPNMISQITAADCSGDTPADVSSISNQFSQRQSNRTDPAKYCQNCQNEISDEVDVPLPPPVYLYSFISECPSPWLHYDYCTPCLEVARFQNTDITGHIAQCEALVDQCWEGELEIHVKFYQDREAELANTTS